MINMKYAGIGSREAPSDVLSFTRELAGILAKMGYTVSSGSADGMDTAFEQGALAAGGAIELWHPWKGFNDNTNPAFYPTDAHFQLAKTLHPAWGALTKNKGDGPDVKSPARMLHARNTGQVLSKDLNTPVAFVLCWTADGAEADSEVTSKTGGTGTAIRLASQRGIPVFNLGRPGSYARFRAFVLGQQRRFHPDGTLPDDDSIFVFGSNLAGRHGKGSALVAKEKFGAVYGCGTGPTGNAYAIPTKDGRPGKPNLKEVAATLPLADIKQSISEFIAYARLNKEKRFFVVRLGCDLAAHDDKDVAPLFAQAPLNCSFPDVWKEWLAGGPTLFDESAHHQDDVAPINIWSGATGLGGALTNMSEMAKKKGGIKHSYPVQVGTVKHEDSESAYQALKRPGDDAYNDGLMVDIIALKFVQNPKLLKLVTKNGGAEWLSKCDHFTGAKSERFQAWEGKGLESRFIRNLVAGFNKSVSGVSVATKVVHCKEAPYDVYIGRANGDLPESIWHNPNVIGPDGTREEVVNKFHEYILGNPSLMAQVNSLHGKTLGCFCKTHKNPNELCHGDVLASLANGKSWVAPEPIQSGLF